MKKYYVLIVFIAITIIIGACGMQGTEDRTIEISPGASTEIEEEPVIETEKATYTIEEYEDKRILWVKVCKKKFYELIDDLQENEESKRE